MGRKINPEDYINKKYGMLTLKKYLYLKNKNRYYECLCDCGKTKICLLANLKSGKQKSCGCIQYKQKMIKINDYVFNDEYVVGITYNTKKQFCVDIKDFEKIKKFCWREDGYGYIVTSKNNKNIKLHHLILNLPSGKVVDHINHDKTDNRKQNLRICSTQQNNFNTIIPKNNTSGFKGVYWSKERNKWVAKIGYNYKNIHLGYFDDKREAIKTRINAEKYFYGEYACER